MLNRPTFEGHINVTPGANAYLDDLIRDVP